MGNIAQDINIEVEWRMRSFDVVDSSMHLARMRNKRRQYMPNFTGRAQVMESVLHYCDGSGDSNYKYSVY